ncbi:TrkA family potassium uptake protein [Halosegnis rubeus]|jgi:Trk K+ transport system NAD-binding subunit|uniref:TrkA family potassium uptake protein n=1 Tax=Halosegnis rubeus TaxID=2212850 RepID=A0A5N5U601_9EURY|nr:NAD-binding protein [Halosegnis rubeus]KAB7514020.1 TrkA family potassium uptake protein [Halosegnis rubeus]KAB7514419.1 TrkA family potassium uptake protein [Halosegnis rubeus]
MTTWRRQTAKFVGGIVVAILVFTLLYDYGMTAFDNRPRTLLESLQVVVETFTTTGYGSDAGWNSRVMTLFVIVMDLTGVVLIFLALPALAFPLLEEELSTTVPTSTDLTDHVVVCGFSERAETLIEELESRGVDTVIAEPDRNAALDRYEDGYTVVHASPDTVDGLLAANIIEARAIVADISDEVDTSIVLTAKELAADVRVVTVAEKLDHTRYHELAGADEVLSPRTLLGESFARKVTTAVSTDLDEPVELGENFDIVELSVRRGSQLVGSSLAESRLREETGVNVIGLWFDGEFQSPPDPAATITSGTILLVSGRDDQIEMLRERTRTDVRRHESGKTLVVGYGGVGRAVCRMLTEAGHDHTTVDKRDIDGVDIVGDGTEAETLRRAGIEEARTVVLAIADDTVAEFATLVCRDLAPDVEIIVRAQQRESVKKLYRAGADYALSLASISGRMTAGTVLDEEVLSMTTQVDIVRTEAPGLVGQTLAEASVRDETGCTVVAVRRDGDEEPQTEVGPDYRVSHGDQLIIAGTDEDVNRFNERFGNS